MLCYMLGYLMQQMPGIDAPKYATPCYPSLHLVSSTLPLLALSSPPHSTIARTTARQPTHPGPCMKTLCAPLFLPGPDPADCFRSGNSA